MKEKEKIKQNTILQHIQLQCGEKIYVGAFSSTKFILPRDLFVETKARSIVLAIDGGHGSWKTHHHR